MKTPFILSISLFLFYVSTAQIVVEKQVLSIISSQDATVGEIVTWTFEGSGISIHHGFHPAINETKTTPVFDLEEHEVNVSIFTNPTA